MRDVERHERVLLHEQDRRALGVDVGDDLEDLLDEDRREAERRLVEEEQLRAGHERATDGEHLLLAARQGAALLCRPLAKPREEVEHAGRVLVGCRPALRVKPPIWRFSVTVRREKIRRPFRRMADAAAHEPERVGTRDLVAVEARPIPRARGGGPRSSRSVVVFPAPFAPMRVTISPRLTVMVMPFSAWMLP